MTLEVGEELEETLSRVMVSTANSLEEIRVALERTEVRLGNLESQINHIISGTRPLSW